MYKQSIILIRILLLFVVAILGSVSFVNAQNEDWSAPSAADKIVNPLKGNSDATKKGKILYQQMCAICHGDQGKGDGIAGAALDPPPGNFITKKVQAQTDGAIFWKMTTGSPPMIAYAEFLKEEQRWQLVNYIRELGKYK